MTDQNLTNRQRIELEGEIRKINLMIVGAHKSGTSSLKNYLGQHPGICTHPQLELPFFINDVIYQKGYHYSYNIYFSHCKNQNNQAAIILGKNVGVMYSETALDRLYTHNPDVRLIVILRNPIDRAYSAYWYARRLGWENIDTFEEAINADLSRFGDDDLKKRTCAYLERSLYSESITNIYRKFKQENIQIYLLEELSRNAPRICNQIVSHFPLLIQNFQFETSRKFNTSALPRDKKIANYLSTPNKYPKLRELVRSCIPAQIRLPIYDFLTKLNEQQFTPPDIEALTRKKLIKYFRKDICQLEKLINRDLSHWNIDYEN